MDEKIKLEFSPEDALDILEGLFRLSVMCGNDPRTTAVYQKYGLQLSSKITQEQIDGLKATNAISDLLNELNNGQ